MTRKEKRDIHYSLARAWMAKGRCVITVKILKVGPENGTRPSGPPAGNSYAIRPSTRAPPAYPSSSLLIWFTCCLVIRTAKAVAGVKSPAHSSPSNLIWYRIPRLAHVGVRRGRRELGSFPRIGGPVRGLWSGSHLSFLSIWYFFVPY